VSFYALRQTVTTTPAQLAGASGRVRIKNLGAVTVYLGSEGQAVATNGYPLAAGAELEFTAGGSIFAVAASSSAELAVLSA